MTPSASGGQPAQILFMKKDKLPIHLSTMVLLIVTITYKLVLVLFGLVIMILRPPVEMQFLKPAMPWVYLGVALNVVCVGGMLALVFCPEMTKRIDVYKRQHLHSEKIGNEHRIWSFHPEQYPHRFGRRL